GDLLEVDLAVLRELQDAARHLGQAGDVERSCLEPCPDRGLDRRDQIVVHAVRGAVDVVDDVRWPFPVLLGLLHGRSAFMPASQRVCRVTAMREAPTAIEPRPSIPLTSSARAGPDL